MIEPKSHYRQAIVFSTYDVTNGRSVNFGGFLCNSAHHPQIGFVLVAMEVVGNTNSLREAVKNVLAEFVR